MVKKSINALVIDDSRASRDITTKVIKQYDMGVVALKSGLDGLALAATESFELVCVAYQLSDITSEDFCSRLRGIPGYQYVTVIFFTGEESNTVLKSAMRAGATDVFSKTQVDQFENYVRRYSEQLSPKMVGRVLLVEDSKSQQALVKKILEDMGLYVEAFFNAEQACKALAKGGFDLVMTDIVLDGEMTGISLIRKIRRSGNQDIDIPVLAISDYDDQSRRIELIHLGVSDYIIKPLIPEEVRARVKNLIQNYRLQKELKSQQDSLQQLALIDPVTGLYNRNSYMELAPKLLENANRSGLAASLVLIDIDHFKSVNDQYGHSRGDAVLASVGEWLKSCLRKGDMVFRWGGEEFVLLLFGCGREKASAVVEKKRAQLEKTSHADLTITASFGISSTEDVAENQDIQTLFNQADCALLQAKETGRNKVCVFQEMPDDSETLV